MWEFCSAPIHNVNKMTWDEFVLSNQPHSSMHISSLMKSSESTESSCQMKSPHHHMWRRLIDLVSNKSFCDFSNSLIRIWRRQVVVVCWSLWLHGSSGYPREENAFVKDIWRMVNKNHQENDDELLSKEHASHSWINHVLHTVFFRCRGCQ